EGDELGFLSDDKVIPYSINVGISITPTCDNICQSSLMGTCYYNQTVNGYIRGFLTEGTPLNSSVQFFNPVFQSFCNYNLTNVDHGYYSFPPSQVVFQKFSNNNLVMFYTLNTDYIVKRNLVTNQTSNTYIYEQILTPNVTPFGSPVQVA